MTRRLASTAPRTLRPGARYVDPYPYEGLGILVGLVLGVALWAAAVGAAFYLFTR